MDPSDALQWLRGFLADKYDVCNGRRGVARDICRYIALLLFRDELVALNAAAQTRLSESQRVDVRALHTQYLMAAVDAVQAAPLYGTGLAITSLLLIACCVVGDGECCDRSHSSRRFWWALWCALWAA